MNKLTQSLIALSLIVCIGLSAQTATNTAVTNYGIISNKVKKSNEAKDDAKKNIKAKFWVQRAELMMEAYDVNRQNLFQGTQQLIVKAQYGEPKEIEQGQDDDGAFEKYIYDNVNVTFKNAAVASFEETKPIYENPLPEALKCLAKAEELDTDKKEIKNIRKAYDNLKKMLERNAVEIFSKEDYNGALICFETIIDINEKPIMIVDGKQIIDTVVFFNAGMTASRVNKNQDAIKYYEMARKNNHKDPNVYVFLKQKYFEVGDTATGLTVIEEGFKRFPDNQSVLIELINYYLVRSEGAKALEYLNIAKKEDPGNISFIFAEATLYDKMGDKEKAKETYLKCTEMDPKFFNGYYNLGVMYYNEAVRLYDEANKLNDQKAYDEAKKKGDEALANALPWMVKAHEVDPTERSTMETLKTLYYRLKMQDKYDEIVKELGE